ncbi:MAG: class I SAM-dependent methyltransferase [Halioglobus sp.]
MNLELPDFIDSVKGFLAPPEGEALYQVALEASLLGPVLEIGSYCGKSTIFLGLACQQTQSTVFALDHHAGSEEHQPGEMFHDAELFNDQYERFDTFGEFRRNIQRAGLTDYVVPVVTGSEQAARHWQTPLGMVFIDGGHSLDAALTDYRCWAGKIVSGGILAIHDIFKDPFEGGQAPHAVMQLALNSGLFEKVEMVSTLAVLRRL